MAEERRVYKVVVGKPEGRRPLRRPRCRWEERLRMDLGDIDWWECGVYSVGSG
jgi:hypothetical protein